MCVIYHGGRFVSGRRLPFLASPFSLASASINIKMSMISNSAAAHDKSRSPLSPFDEFRKCLLLVTNCVFDISAARSLLFSSWLSKSMSLMCCVYEFYFRGDGFQMLRCVFINVCFVTEIGHLKSLAVMYKLVSMVLW